jgi:ABC-type ATPase involved in cell division
MATHARELVKQAHRRIIILENGRIASDTSHGELPS